MILTRETLSDAMDFDRVIHVHTDGTVSFADSVFSPELYGDDVQSGWTLLSGYTGQDRYNGPIMHPSEQISGRLADDILATPGYYVALVANDSPVGWAIAYMDESLTE